MQQKLWVKPRKQSYSKPQKVALFHVLASCFCLIRVCKKSPVHGPFWHPMFLVQKRLNDAMDNGICALWLVRGIVLPAKTRRRKKTKHPTAFCGSFAKQKQLYKGVFHPPSWRSISGDSRHWSPVFLGHVPCPKQPSLTKRAPSLEGPPVARGGRCRAGRSAPAAEPPKLHQSNRILGCLTSIGHRIRHSFPRTQEGGWVNRHYTTTSSQPGAATPTARMEVHGGEGLQYQL